jgi:hypothetical protein
MLTEPREFKDRDDWLAAVLESHTLALVQCNNDVTLRALAPYRALRSLYDDSPSGPIEVSNFQQPRATSLFQEWIRTGAWPAVAASQVLISPDLGAGATMRQRHQEVVEWIESVQQYLAKRYLAEGPGLGELGGYKVAVNTPKDLVDAPMFAQIATSARDCLNLVRDAADVALQLATSRAEGEEYAGDRPLM